MVWSRPPKEEVAGFYDVDNYYTHGALGIAANKQALSLLDRLRAHVSWRLDASDILAPSEVLPLLKESNPTICEIGCGHGYNLSAFKREGFAVFGVEPDPTAREIAKKLRITSMTGWQKNYHPRLCSESTALY